SRSGTLPPSAISTTGAASILETLHIDELPSGPITVHATFGADAAATSTGGFAHANASLVLNAFSAGTGTSSISANSGSAPLDLSTCNVPGSSSAASGMSVTLTPQQLMANAFQVHINIDASAQLESVDQIQEAEAQVTGGGAALLAARRTA